MTTRLAVAAEKRLAERRGLVCGPLAMAQKALWEALLRGDMTEALRQSDIVRAIHGRDRRRHWR